MIAVAVLLDGVPKGLAGEGVLQFGGRDWEAVETEQNVGGLIVLPAEMDLAGDGEAESLSEEIDAVAEHFECAA